MYLDLGDADRWAALFTANAVYQVYGREFTAHDGLRLIVTAAPGGFHLGGAPMIDVDGDRATTMRNLLFVDQGSGGAGGQCTTRTWCVPTPGGVSPAAGAGSTPPTAWPTGPRREDDF